MAINFRPLLKRVSLEEGEERKISVLNRQGTSCYRSTVVHTCRPFANQISSWSDLTLTA